MRCLISLLIAVAAVAYAGDDFDVDRSSPPARIERRPEHPASLKTVEVAVIHDDGFLMLEFTLDPRQWWYVGWDVNPGDTATVIAFTVAKFWAPRSRLSQMRFDDDCNRHHIHFVYEGNEIVVMLTHVRDSSGSEMVTSEIVNRTEGARFIELAEAGP